MTPEQAVESKTPRFRSIGAWKTKMLKSLAVMTQVSEQRLLSSIAPLPQQTQQLFTIGWWYEEYVADVIKSRHFLDEPHDLS